MVSWSRRHVGRLRVLVLRAQRAHGAAPRIPASRPVADLASPGPWRAPSRCSSRIRSPGRWRPGQTRPVESVESIGASGSLVELAGLSGRTSRSRSQRFRLGRLRPAALVGLRPDSPVRIRTTVAGGSTIPWPTFTTSALRTPSCRSTGRACLSSASASWPLMARIVPPGRITPADSGTSRVQGSDRPRGGDVGLDRAGQVFGPAAANGDVGQFEGGDALFQEDGAPQHRFQQDHPRPTGGASRTRGRGARPPSRRLLLRPQRGPAPRPRRSSAGAVPTAGGPRAGPAGRVRPRRWPAGPRTGWPAAAPGRTPAPPKQAARARSAAQRAQKAQQTQKTHQAQA